MKTETMNEKTCGSCLFWHKKQQSAMNIQDVRGECRCNPPGTTTFPNGVIAASYPSLPPNYPACAQHRARFTNGQASHEQELKIMGSEP